MARSGESVEKSGLSLSMALILMNPATVVMMLNRDSSLPVMASKKTVYRMDTTDTGLYMRR